MWWWAGNFSNNRMYFVCPQRSYDSLMDFKYVLLRPLYKYFVCRLPLFHSVFHLNYTYLKSEKMSTEKASYLRQSHKKFGIYAHIDRISDDVAVRHTIQVRFTSIVTYCWIGMCMWVCNVYGNCHCYWLTYGVVRCWWYVCDVKCFRSIFSFFSFFAYMR